MNEKVYVKQVLILTDSFNLIGILNNIHLHVYCTYIFLYMYIFFLPSYPLHTLIPDYFFTPKTRGILWITENLQYKIFDMNELMKE